MVEGLKTDCLDSNVLPCHCVHALVDDAIRAFADLGDLFVTGVLGFQRRFLVRFSLLVEESIVGSEPQFGEP